MDEQYIAEPQRCYTFKQENFKETLKIPEDIFVNLALRNDEVERISFKFALSTGSFDTYNCSSDKPKHYECIGSENNSKSKIQFYLKDGSMYLHIDHMEMSPSYKTVPNHIRSKDKTFCKGIKTSCYLSEETYLPLEDVEKGSKKEKLLKSIDISDLIIYDLDYYKDLVIAVGADNSPKTRELQSQDEHHEAVIIRSEDAGKTWKRVEDGACTPYDTVIILDSKNIVTAGSMEGSGGFIFTSSNSGRSWKNTYSGGMISSFKKVEKEIVATDIVGTTIRSKDNGKTWHETPLNKNF